MKQKYNVLLIALLLAFASCSFTTNKFDGDSDKEKLLIQLITYVIDQGHFSPKTIDDDFSENVFDNFLLQLDPFKRFFLKSDIKEFEKYKYKIDDQLQQREVDFFVLVHDRLIQRHAEAKLLYKRILEKPFNFNANEEYNADFENLPYAKNNKALTERWRSQLKFSALSYYHDLLDSSEDDKSKTKKDVDVKRIEVEAREKTLNALEELFTYFDDRRREDWFAMYLNAVVEEFDPHTSYFAPVERDRFDIQMSGKLEGIGAQLRKKLDKISVVSLVSGGPAWRQNKLEAGDVILKVKQENEKEAVSIVGMRIDDAVKLIKGPKGTTVTLTLKKVDGTIEELEIVRDIVETEETYAKATLVEKNEIPFGVINLPGFYADFKDYNKRNAASDVKKEIERLKKQGIQGLVLDLRNNGGGSLKTVVDLAGLFIKKGPVVQVRATGKPKQILSDEDESVVWDGPLVIMVNELSASASEILAAAMQDYKRAIIIGSKQTFGKGTVQQYLDLNRFIRGNESGDLGAFKYTTQKYYRINGGSTQLEGVKSDVVVPDRYSYIDIGEKDQDDPLPWDEITAANYKVFEKQFNYAKAIKNSRERMLKDPQLQLIDKNAKWIKKARDKYIFSLNYNTYINNLKIAENEAKSFEKIKDYKSNLTFKSLPYEQNLIATDTVLKEKRKRWHSNLNKDVYINEALNVLIDLKKPSDTKKIIISNHIND